MKGVAPLEDLALGKVFLRLDDVSEKVIVRVLFLFAAVVGCTNMIRTW